MKCCQLESIGVYRRRCGPRSGSSSHTEACRPHSKPMTTCQGSDLPARCPCPPPASPSAWPNPPGSKENQTPETPTPAPCRRQRARRPKSQHSSTGRRCRYRPPPVGIVAGNHAAACHAATPVLATVRLPALQAAPPLRAAASAAVSI
jgi:hypothetical protein